METVDCVIAGAGVIGLAVAREVSKLGLETLVLDSADAIGTETSSRNSEVIHGGIYYPPGSLKADLCVTGRRKLYDFARQRNIAHKRCGKLIVATSSDQEARLASLVSSGRACGVDDLIPLTAAEAEALEPALQCRSAILSPSTGIIDSHELMLALLAEAEEHGCFVALNTSIVSGRIEQDRVVLRTLDRLGRNEYEIAASCFINAGGLSANAIARSLEGFDQKFVPPLHLARGSYFSVTGKPAFSRLIYPIPEPGGLGIHLTLDLNGSMRFGPDVEWIDSVDYRVDPQRAKDFYAEIRKYWPALPDDSLQPAYSGIRPKLSAAGESAADFMIQGPDVHGVKNLVNLFGIESPGLTSCLAIAEHAARMLSGRDLQ